MTFPAAPHVITKILASRLATSKLMPAATEPVVSAPAKPTLKWMEPAVMLSVSLGYLNPHTGGYIIGGSVHRFVREGAPYWKASLADAKFGTFEEACAAEEQWARNNMPEICDKNVIDVRSPQREIPDPKLHAPTIP